MNKKLKVAIFLVFDLFFMSVAWILSFLILRLNVGATFVNTYYYFIALIVLTYGCIFAVGLYTNIMRYAGTSEAIKVMVVSACVLVFSIIIAIIDNYNTNRLDISWAFVSSVIFMSELAFSRFFFRIVDAFSHYRIRRINKSEAKKVIIVGGGSAGAMLIREITTSKHINLKAMCVLDDDKNKVGNSICGVKVVGTIDEVDFYANKFEVDEIIIAIPTMPRARKLEVFEKCQHTGCKIMSVPGLYQLMNEQVTVNAIKEVSIQDLLGREQIKVNVEEIIGYIENKVVVVTGGGGSIGSELCRQIAKHNPKQLIIIDIYENNAYDIQQELVSSLPNLNLLVLIASVRDSKKMNDIFAKYKPHVVFHAAAHKHVPLMETSPNEAVKNNVSGTLKVAEASGKNGVERFILISTDKAVNPTNIMGATKRICEMIIQAMNHKYPSTNYVAVRFGNVLGSNGSVVPLFKKQIEAGGPVTVTDERIVRYFMTIPEAVSLVLQAGAYAKGGEIFVLDMGDPVRIYELAENMIRLSGYEPNKDIKIKITGLRPGEKLYEERLMDEEGLEKTANDLISIGKPLIIDEKQLFEKVSELYIEAYNETDKMKELVHELVPTYKIDKG